ncbi:hypothetical protein RIR_e8544_A0A2N1MWS5_9GLOM [Rhizophagus irregularis DAOM 181602=DAOM 197198]|uniref:Uncharacterized protein n=1 Tax=Rhizophagus irregularis TaxID=588596 RepID=A0A2N1MWS5_9GLOM|nr:hypothetical protein RhiirC2_754123 [Rhizophagus irregularis]GET60521.1 hypothetical protein RIR_e8544_A0A2N1MWS5_9GLOM [Rhizophagus irregularis DAOM 181602=DAOM 197198]
MIGTIKDTMMKITSKLYNLTLGFFRRNEYVVVWILSVIMIFHEIPAIKPGICG